MVCYVQLISCDRCHDWSRLALIQCGALLPVFHSQIGSSVQTQFSELHPSSGERKVIKVHTAIVHHSAASAGATCHACIGRRPYSRQQKTTRIVLVRVGAGATAKCVRTSNGCRKQWTKLSQKQQYSYDLALVLTREFRYHGGTCAGDASCVYWKEAMFTASEGEPQ